MSSPHRVIPIAFLSHRADRTGAPLCMLDLIRHGDRERFPARVLLGEEGPLIDDLEAAGAEVRVLPRKQARGTGRVLQLRRVLRDFEARVVHLTSAVGFTKSAALAARSLAMPVLWHLHDDFGHPKFRRRRAWVRWLSHRIVACSQSIAREIPSPKTVVVENGVLLPRLPDPAERSAARRELGVPDDACVIVFVGSFTPRKNPLLIVGAARRLIESRPDLHFVLVGGGDKEQYRASVEKRAEPSGQVHLFDERPDVDVFYRAADLVLLPSTMECHPRVLLEASAWSLPTLATPVGDVSRMIEDGRSGWIFPVPEDADALHDALESVLAESPEEWQRRGRAARQDLAERCAMDRYVGRIEEEWARLTGSAVRGEGA